MHLPRAEFWRLWGVFALLVALVMTVFSGLDAHAEMARGHGRHHHHRHAHVRSLHAHAVPLHARHRSLHVRGAAVRTAAARGGDAVAIAMRYVGSGNPTGSGRAWCGDFVNMTERMAGRPGLAAGGLASAWSSYGRASAPVRGAIAVMRGHVSRVLDRVGDSVRLVSGNWSHRVSVHVARIADVVAFRMP